MSRVNLKHKAYFKIVIPLYKKVAFTFDYFLYFLVFRAFHGCKKVAL
nr:MAG TPA: hypothetical protein [Caudoviricetes sp.]